MAERMAVIIGAGAAGMYAGRELARQKVRHVIVERQSASTHRESKAYFCEHHTSACALVGREAVRLDKDEYDQPSTTQHGPLSTWDRRALRTKNPLSADYADIVSGVTGTHAGVGGDAATQTVFSFALHALREKDQNPIMHETRVVDVRRRETDYVIQCRCRENNTFVNRSYVASIVFVCVPPARAAQWTIVQQWARAQLHAVVPIPVHRLVCDGAADGYKSTLMGRPSSYDRDSTMFITSGRLAEFWQRLSLYSDIVFAKTVSDELGPDVRVVRAEFSQNGMHTWRPTPYFDADRAAAKALQPNSRHLPNVYWCCNAYSAFQGWLEGDVQAVEGAMHLVFSKTFAVPRRWPLKCETIIEGRIVRTKDLEKWTSIKDAGQYALRDASDEFYHTQCGVEEWAAVYGLQQAFVS